MDNALTQQHFVNSNYCGLYEVETKGHHLQNRWKTDLVARTVQRKLMSEDSIPFQWVNRL